MSKHDVLAYLAEIGAVDAIDVARTFDLTYPAAAMALLRLLRQGLVRRYIDDGRGTYWYTLTDRGHARLAYFETTQDRANAEKT